LLIATLKGNARHRVLAESLTSKCGYGSARSVLFLPNAIVNNGETVNFTAGTISAPVEDR
jgi:hypothetical protein